MGIDADTLKQAVEILGWVRDDGVIIAPWGSWHPDIHKRTLKQYQVDHIAAELVRMVDAKQIGIRFSDLGSCKVGGRYYNAQNWHHKGDRTENTLNAIVEFARENPGVLK